MSKLKSLEELFGGRHFDREIIILCVRRYLRDKLRLRDLVDGDYRWLTQRSCAGVRRYTPECVNRWNRFATPAGRSWRVDSFAIRMDAPASRKRSFNFSCVLSTAICPRWRAPCWTIGAPLRNICIRR